MKRTIDKGFFNCPICGKPPYVKFYPPNSGAAYCKGNLFRQHTQLYSEVVYAPPSELLRTLAERWNDIVFHNEPL